jgi:hypothetical protein
MRNMDLKRTSPVNFVTSPTKPSQLSLGMFTRLTLSSRLATAGELIAGLFLFFCNVMSEVTPGTGRVTCCRCASGKGQTLIKEV